MLCYLNNDTTATNYRAVYSQSNGTAVSTALSDTALISAITAGTSAAAQCGQGTIKIYDYAGTNFNKQIECLSQYRATAVSYLLHIGTEWESAAAVNRVDLVLSAGNYDTGSTLRLYGVY
jgi:hypothetical protein